MPTPAELFKKHCKSNATFKQYETFELGYRLGVQTIDQKTYVQTSDDSAAKYENAVSAYNKMAENYKKAEQQLSDGITLFAEIYNALPEGNEYREKIAEFLTKPD